MKKNFSILYFLLLQALQALAQQPRISLATDLSLQHSFKKHQRFTALALTLQTQFHLTPKDAVYIGFAYNTQGRFTNKLTATAKLPAIVPQQIVYINNAIMRISQLSIGWKKYFWGNAEAETGIHIYTSAGFGLLMGRIQNTHSPVIDSNLYFLPVLSGKAKFKRLTFDVSLGVEKYLGTDIFLYGEARLWIPAEGYPSRYLLINNRAPYTGMLCAGLRVLF